MSISSKISFFFRFRGRFLAQSTIRIFSGKSNGSVKKVEKMERLTHYLSWKKVKSRHHKSFFLRFFLGGIQKGRLFFPGILTPPPRANVPPCPYSIPKIQTFEKCLFSTDFLLKTEVPFFRRTIFPRRHSQVALSYF